MTPLHALWVPDIDLSAQHVSSIQSTVQSHGAHAFVICLTKDHRQVKDENVYCCLTPTNN